MLNFKIMKLFKNVFIGIILIFLFISCARELEDEAGKVASVRMGIDYWDSSSRSFLTLRRLFREDSVWKKGINTEIVFAVPEDENFEADPKDLKEIIDFGLVDINTSSIDLTIPLDTPIKLFAYRYVEVLSLSLAKNSGVTYDSFGESNSFSVSSRANTAYVTIFLNTNGTPSLIISDKDGLSITNEKTSESTIANSFQFLVKLGKKPKSDVVIPIRSEDTTEGTVSPSSLIFSRSNWDLPKTVTVTGVSHSGETPTDSSDQDYIVTVGATESEDPDYIGIQNKLSVTNIDISNGTFEIVDNVKQLITSESDGEHKTDTIKIRLVNKPNAKSL